MKSLILSSLLLSSVAFAQMPELPRLSPNAKVSQTCGLTDISVDYSSPGVRGRKIWGNVVKWNEVWRAGANSATKVTFSKDVSIGGTAVPAGTYALFVQPTQKSWTIIINKEANQWGSFAYHKEFDLVKVEVKPETIANREHLTYSFPSFDNNTATLALDWEKVRVALPIKLDTEKQVTASIKQIEDNPQGMLNQAARYELEQKKDYDAGLRLVDASLKLKEDWFNTWTKAQLEHAKGNDKDALSLAQKAQDLGSKTPERFFYADEVKKALVEWKPKTSAK
jgi:hypothetical protein